MPNSVVKSVVFNAQFRAPFRRPFGNRTTLNKNGGSFV
jgi:hypothetical protein